MRTRRWRSLRCDGFEIVGLLVKNADFMQHQNNALNVRPALFTGLLSTVFDISPAQRDPELVF